MELKEIKDERELYRAVHEYSSRIWSWGAHLDEDWNKEPTPDELIAILQERIEWVKAHQRAIDRYLRRMRGPGWVRVFDGPRADSSDGDPA